MTNIIDKGSDMVKKFILSIALKKGVISAAKLIVSYALAHGIRVSASIGGVDIDTTSEAGMTLAINSALASLKNLLKTKYPDKFGWI